MSRRSGFPGTNLPLAPSVLALVALVAACGAGPEDTARGAAVSPACRIVQPSRPLPLELAETSGAALAAGGELAWTHNDSGGETALFAVRPSGEIVARVEVENAENTDWEDIAAGPCLDGRCLYIADIGDNEGKRDQIAIYRVAEPDPTTQRTVRAERFPVRYPGGPRDAESIFVLPAGELYVITKGRTSNIAIYRYPLPLRADQEVDLVHVADLSAGRADLADQVTGADATPNGEWVAVRDYRSLRIYPTESLLRGGTAAAPAIDLASLGEPQGEGVAILDDGRVVLTSEGVGKGVPGHIAVLACEAAVTRR